MFVHIVDGTPVIKTLRTIKAENPNVSLPTVNAEEALVSLGYYPLVVGPIPEYNPSTHKFVNSQTPVLVDGVWTLQREIVEYTQEEKQEADYIMGKQIRAERTNKLAETDYLALSDVTMSDEMKAYRQALRDITIQDGFPWNVVWPVKP